MPFVIISEVRRFHALRISEKYRCPSEVSRFQRKKTGVRPVGRKKIVIFLIITLNKMVIFGLKSVQKPKKKSAPAAG